MTDDLYQLAIAAIRHHLEEAGADYELDEGEFEIGGHRLGLAITFEEFVEQAGQVIAPLDVQIHLDGDTGDRFRVGTLGVGPDRHAAMNGAIAEWHLLAASPVLTALGADVSTRRRHRQQLLAGWDLFPGRAGIRGPIPPELAGGGALYQSLLTVLHGLVSAWEKPARFTLRSVYLMVTASGDTREVQAAVDGYLDESLSRAIADLPWPQREDAYLYKQLFVLRSQGD